MKQRKSKWIPFSFLSLTLKKKRNFPIMYDKFVFICCVFSSTSSLRRQEQSSFGNPNICWKCIIVLRVFFPLLHLNGTPKAKGFLLFALCFLYYFSSEYKTVCRKFWKRKKAFNHCCFDRNSSFYFQCSLV